MSTTIDTTDEMIRLLDITELAKHLNVTERFIRRLVHERRVPFLKIGKFIRFNPDDVVAGLNEKRVA